MSVDSSAKETNSKSLSRRVLVLGKDTRSFLSSVRSFGRAGLKVDVGWVDYLSPALKSRYINEVVYIPAYRHNSDAWLNAINRLVRERDYEFVVACHDEQVLPLQHHRDRLEQIDRFALIPDKAFTVCFSKKLTYDLAYSLGIPVPEQITAHSQADISAMMDEWQSDIYIKPISSTNISNVSHRNDVIRVNRLEVVPHFEDETLQAGLLVQRAVSGCGVGIELLAKEGRILASFQHARIHEPPTGGGSSYRRSVAVDGRMFDAAGKLITALEYTGVAMIEFKYDAHSDRWWLMEINGRFWGSLPLTVASGMDMPYYWYQMLRQDRTEFPQSYRKNIYCRSWSPDRNWLVCNMRARRSNAALLTLSPFSILAEVRHLLFGRERSDTFVLDDPKPAAAELRQIFVEPIIRRARKLSVFRNYARMKAEKALATARSILFVCYGNICRSPFAEKQMQSKFDIPVCSAGTHPQDGRCCPQDAIQAALKHGIDLDTHRSRLLVQQMIDAADVIFVFDMRNELSVLAQFPTARAKVHQIASLDDGDCFVDDPFDNGAEAFDRCYDRISKLVYRVASLIGGHGQHV